MYYQKIIFFYLQIVMLTFLLSFQVKSCQSSQVLLANSLINRGTPADTLPVVMSRIGPPIRLHLHVPQNHVFNRNRQSRYFPGNVCLPAPPRLGEVLQDRPSLVLLDALRHHVDNVVHDRGSQFEIEVGFDSLLGHSFGNTFGVAAFKLARKQVAQPALQQGRDSAHEKEPDTPARGPDSATWAFTYWTLEMNGRIAVERKKNVIKIEFEYFLLAFRNFDFL